MQVCAIASARATIGGPSFELRTPSRNASFHRRTTLPPGWTPRVLDASLGNASDAAPAPAATRNCRRESDCSRTGERDLLGPREIEPRHAEVKTSREVASAAVLTLNEPLLGGSRPAVMPTSITAPHRLSWNRDVIRPWRR